jgi:multiple sugar transport system substrate-binding protein
MRAFGIIFVVLVVATWAVGRTRVGALTDGRVALVWVSDNNPARQEHLDQFNRLNPDLRLVLDPANRGAEKVIVQSLGGVGPDVFDSYSPSQLAAYVRSGIAWDITEELAKRGIDVKSEVWGCLLEQVVHEGRVYGMPSNVSVDALFFNKEALEKAGVKLKGGPWTWEEFLPVAKKLTVRDEAGRVQQYGLALDDIQWRTLLMQFGGRVYSADGTKCVLDSAEAIAAVQFMHDLIYKHQVVPSPLEREAMAEEGGWGSGGIKMLSSGRAAMAIGGRWWLCTLRNYDGLRLGAVEAPHTGERVFRAYGKAILVNSKSENRERALDFLEYMTTAEYARLVNQQADGLAPTPKHCTSESLVVKEFPDEDSGEVFLSVVPLGRSDDISPFVNAALADRIITRQLDLALRDTKSVAEAMRTAAREVNEAMEKELRRDAELRQRYEQLVGGGQ